MRILALVVIFLTALSLAEDTNAGFIEKADVALANGDYAAAIKEYSKAFKRDSNCHICVQRLATAHSRLGQEKNARKYAEMAITMAATPAESAAARVAKAEAMIPFAQGNFKKLKEMESELRLALQQDPSNGIAHMDLGAVLASAGRTQEALEELREYLKLGRNQENIDRVKKWIEHPRSITEPLAPEFEFQDITGARVTLSSLHGKVVVLDFWATWCGPCRSSVGELKDFRSRYSQDDMVLVSVSVDKDENKWRSFVAAEKMNWLQYRDHDGRISELFAVRSYPTYLVIDRDGYIVKRIEGMNPTESVGYRLREQMKGMVKN